MSGGSNSADERLRLLVERVEALLNEKQNIAEDVKDVYLEAKAVGYDAKIIREVIRLRKLSADDLQERNALLQTYGAALGLDLL
jgi:uncharacterized protein (UPF0335 family)